MAREIALLSAAGITLLILIAAFTASLSGPLATDTSGTEPSAVSSEVPQALVHAGWPPYAGGDIVDGNATLENVTIVQPLLVMNSSVTFLNVSFENTTTIIDSEVSFINITYINYSYPEQMPFDVLLNITASNVTFTHPLPGTTRWGMTGVMPEVLIENSIIIFPHDFEEGLPPVPWPFTYSANNYLLFLGNFSSGFGNDDIFFFNNTFEFWGEKQAGAFYVLNGTLITHGACIRLNELCEPYVVENIRQIAYDDAYGDIRLIETSYFEAHNITALDTVHVRDRSHAVFINSQEVGAEVFGEARLTLINTTAKGFAMAAWPRLCLSDERVLCTCRPRGA